ncbi:hypothetical protein ONZ45_g1346 [Pleurotus djamor]|nr:hypothetical protein ONZ45_g1346 [Pleurotus djamor]
MAFSTSTPARPRSPNLSFAHSPIIPRRDEIPQGTASSVQSFPSYFDPPSSEELLREQRLELQEQDLIYTARSIFDQRELSRAVQLLEGCQSSKALFLKVYFKFMASEKESLRDWHKLDNNRSQPPVPVNKSLGALFEEVKTATDPWLIFFLWIMSLRANCLYNLHDFKQAEEQFDKIHLLDPRRVDDIDIFSNILYVTDNRLKLSKLAHEFLRLDKDRPEVCCLVGNHYSLRAEHEKAVKYFRRATQLDRTYLSAWTLMGHEYVEMKNSHAAIEAYRRAVDVNRKDYRAWYGLGQAYELLSMHQYALHYYQHATALRPYDVRLWQAQGMCYEEIGRYSEAIDCLRRALIGADPREINIYLKLAGLHQRLGQLEESIAYHRKVVELKSGYQERPVGDYAKSCLDVAEYHTKTEQGDLRLAREYAEIVAGSNVEEVGRASDLLQVIKQRMYSIHAMNDAGAGARGRGAHQEVPADVSFEEP